jgi:hypothetical protein
LALRGLQSRVSDSAMFDKPECPPLPATLVCQFEVEPSCSLQVHTLRLILRSLHKPRGFTMSEEIELQVTRRKLYLLVGLAASFAVPVTVLTASNAEAQQPAEQAPKKKKKQKQAPIGTAPTPSEKPKAQ